MTISTVEGEPTIRIATEERRDAQNLVILFAELISPAAQSEPGHDDATEETLGRYSGLLTEVIQKHQGQVIKAMGDSAMAEFAHPGAAVRAAVDMERLLMESSEEFPQDAQPGLRIGIHGLTGDCKRIDLFGGVVHLAASITKHAASGQILVSREVCDTLSSEKDLHFQWFRKVAIDGQMEGEDIYEAHWATAIAGIPSRYEAMFQVGAGGMGMVYKVRDRETDEIVALKVLRSEIASDPAMQENLRREVCLARKVTHKNVCRIHEFNRSNGMAYISMEFVEGASLLTTLQRSGPLSWNQALKIVRQICSGLAEAHAQGIVHRDLKPANIMMDRGGVAKIMDFGIARPFQGTGQMTGTLVGTPAYMAPEQLELKGVDARTDIYAIGLLLYEIVTGSQAFEGDTPIAVAVKQLQEFPKRPREIVPTLPAYAEAVILKCLQKNPDKRYQSMEELAAALQNNLQAQPTLPLWQSFVADMRSSLSELRRELQPRLEVAFEVLRQQDWRLAAEKRWRVVTGKITQKQFTAGLGAACLLCGAVAFAHRSTRKNQAMEMALVGNSPTIAMQNSQIPVAKPVAADVTDRLGARGPYPLPAKPSLAGGAAPIRTYEVDLGPDPESSNIGLQPKSPKVLPSSPQKIPNVSGARIARSEKPRPATAISASPSVGANVTAPPVETQTKPVQPAAATSAVPAPNPAGPSALKTEPPASELSASVFPSAGPTASAEAASEEKVHDESPAAAGHYWEVGSFKDSTWADQAVAKLTQLGFHAVSVHKNLLWLQSYQVRVGPYPDTKNMESARQDLITQGFKPHPVK